MRLLQLMWCASIGTYTAHAMVLTYSWCGSNSTTAFGVSRGLYITLAFAFHRLNKNVNDFRLHYKDFKLPLNKRYCFFSLKNLPLKDCSALCFQWSSHQGSHGSWIVLKSAGKKCCQRKNGLEIKIMEGPFLWTAFDAVINLQAISFSLYSSGYGIPAVCHLFVSEY